MMTSYRPGYVAHGEHNLSDKPTLLAWSSVCVLMAGYSFLFIASEEIISSFENERNMENYVYRSRGLPGCDTV